MKDRLSSSLFPCLVDALIAYSLCTKEAYRTDMDKRVGGWGGSAGGSEGGSGGGLWAGHRGAEGTEES